MRLDILLFEKGLVESRSRAQALILEGRVFVDGKRADKAGRDIGDDSHIEIQGKDHPYVSRGGVKLEGALRAFRIDCKGMTALDVGASTGGFTDCLIRHGAKRVYAIDVGYGQLDWGLRNDDRVVNIEKTNVRYLDPGIIPDPLDIVTIDCSFISLKLVLPKIASILSKRTEIICLVKPQFEVGKGEVGRGGVVKDREKHKNVLIDIANFSTTQGFVIKGLIASPILGPKGNREFFLYLIKGEGDKGIDISSAIERAIR